MSEINSQKKGNKSKEIEDNIKETPKGIYHEHLSNLSHEIRTPITAIIGFSKMLQEELYGDLNPKQMQYVTAINESGNYLLNLINDFLDISKIEAQKQELFKEKIPVQEVCQSSISLVKEKAKQQGLIIKLIIENNVDFCFADPIRLKQILINLLSNAIKFTEIGSVTLKVEKTVDHLIFSIIDTGIGIKKSDQEKLFKPFSQIRNNLHQNYKGTGLGLALSLKLAKLHGGEIRVFSEEGKGSNFTLYLPL